MPPPEAPGRLVKVLRQVLADAEMIGVDQAEAWAVVGELAMGCIPAVGEWCWSTSSLTVAT